MDMLDRVDADRINTDAQIAMDNLLAILKETDNDVYVSKRYIREKILNVEHCVSFIKSVVEDDG